MEGWGKGGNGGWVLALRKREYYSRIPQVNMIECRVVGPVSCPPPVPSAKTPACTFCQVFVVLLLPAPPVHSNTIMADLLSPAADEVEELRVRIALIGMFSIRCMQARYRLRRNCTSERRSISIAASSNFHDWRIFGIGCLHSYTVHLISYAYRLCL
jgi:hypothetical protein